MISWSSIGPKEKSLLQTFGLRNVYLFTSIFLDQAIERPDPKELIVVPTNTDLLLYPNILEKDKRGLCFKAIDF